MIDPENHHAPVEDATLWQRPEHLAAFVGVSVRTLRKWATNGRAERRRDREGQVFYRLLDADAVPTTSRAHQAQLIMGQRASERTLPVPPLVLPPVMVPEPEGPVPEPIPTAPGPEAEGSVELIQHLISLNAKHEAHIEQLHACIATVQQESARHRARVAEATESLELMRMENTQLRAELKHYHEFESRPWWSKKRRRDVTIPMTPLEAE